MKKLTLIAIQLPAILIFLFFWSFWLLAEVFIKIATIIFNDLSANQWIHEDSEGRQDLPIDILYPTNTPIAGN